MATKEELFVSISPGAYRSGKSNILISQTDLLTTLKRLHNLRVLTRQKQDLKIRLNKLFSAVSSDIDSLQDKMPTPRVPKSVHKAEEVKEEAKETFSKRNDIEEELRLINEKLRELNS